MWRRVIWYIVSLYPKSETSSSSYMFPTFYETSRRQIPVGNSSMLAAVKTTKLNKFHGVTERPKRCGLYGQTDRYLYCLMLSVWGVFLRSSHKCICYSDSILRHLPVPLTEPCNKMTHEHTNQPISISFTSDKSTSCFSVIGGKESHIGCLVTRRYSQEKRTSILLNRYLFYLTTLNRFKRLRTVIHMKVK
jgi:hypothetical protein